MKYGASPITIKEEEVEQGGKILRFDPYNRNEITSSPFVMKFLEDVNCLGFCQRVHEVAGYHDHIIGIFSLTLKEDKINIAGIDFIFSVDDISKATCIPKHGENWLKGMNLDLEEYKPYLKSQYKGDRSHVFPSDMCWRDMNH